jgi:hypothetical protein
VPQVLTGNNLLLRLAVAGSLIAAAALAHISPAIFVEGYRSLPAAPNS